MTRPKNNFKRDIKYICSQCGREVGQGNLVAESVQFRGLGANRRVFMTRTMRWLCQIPNGTKPSCFEQHPAYTAKQFVDAPGWADTKDINK